MSSDTTLVLERRPGKLRLYLGGDLQFDTDDEPIYHERLAHPALLAARARFEEPLNLLVLGGGDGLLVRELLRHERRRVGSGDRLQPGRPGPRGHRVRPL